MLQLSKMASMMSEVQFRCVICQDVYKDPVSLPCGHNFCLQCTQRYWETSSKTQCPMCKELFTQRPDLRVNVGLRDITEHFKRHASLKQPTKPAVPKRNASMFVKADQLFCDVCVGNKLPAVRLCTDCHASYCHAHLRPHREDAAMDAHRLTDPVVTVGRRCRTHNKQLDLFCIDERMPVCSGCSRQHQRHKVVSMETESRRVKAELKKTAEGLQRMIRSRNRKKEEIQAAVHHSKANRERELQASIQMFDAVLEASATNQAMLVDEIEWKQEQVEKMASRHLDDLQQETDELQRRCGELTLLETTEDPLYLLQSFTGLSTPPAARDWTAVNVPGSSYHGAIRRALSKLVKVCADLERALCAEELNESRKHAVDVTMDEVTAACWLLLSPDGKQVRLSVQPQKVANDPRRFDSCASVLGKEGFTSGRRYWEVQVGDKTDWDLGVARESINRKGAITVRPDNGYWAICRRDAGSLSACAGPPVTLHLNVAPKKVGVFLDYEGGAVTFYNAEANTHIYTYSGCAFTERLFPYFNPCLHNNGKNLAPLVICPVHAPVSVETDVI